MADPSTRDELDALAAEYVLGVLDTDIRREAAALIDRDGTMRVLVADWQQRFSPLDAGYDPVPAPDLWPALDRQLFAPGRRRNRVFWLVVAGLAVALVVKVAFWIRLLF